MKAPQPSVRGMFGGDVMLGRTATGNLLQAAVDDCHDA